MRSLFKPHFFGGVHPKGKKEQSLVSKGITSVAPSEVAIPLRQHVGTPCRPLVSVGSHVLRGQKLGDGEGLCVPVHASVSGTVVAIENRRHPSGGEALSIVIANDFSNDTVFYSPIDVTAPKLDANAILTRIREAGIVGMGGAAFPSSVKASLAQGKIDTLICNACECEPQITADDLLLRTNAEGVLQGMLLLSRILGPQRTVLAIENNKPEAISAVRKLLPQFPTLSLRVLPTKYPQGAEKQLVQAITGCQVPPGELPVEVGCMVLNASTFAAINDAVAFGKPLFERIVTVTGDAVRFPGNFRVPVGTSFADLVKAAGGLAETAERVIAGGPMMGAAQEDLAAPVVKATNCVLCLMANKNTVSPQTACIRCGKCLRVCPMHLQPLAMYRYQQKANVEMLVRLHVPDCMECGACAYACPAKLPLTESFRLAKDLCKEESAQ